MSDTVPKVRISDVICELTCFRGTPDIKVNLDLTSRIPCLCYCPYRLASSSCCLGDFPQVPLWLRIWPKATTDISPGKHFWKACSFTDAWHSRTPHVVDWLLSLLKSNDRDFEAEDLTAFVIQDGFRFKSSTVFPRVPRTSQSFAIQGNWASSVRPQVPPTF